MALTRSVSSSCDLRCLPFGWKIYRTRSCIHLCHSAGSHYRHETDATGNLKKEKKGKRERKEDFEISQQVIHKA